MTGIDSWAIVPATNSTTDGGSINWSEGQPPSSVNNSARQMLADTRSLINDLAWFQYGTGTQASGTTYLAVPAVYSSATAFTITGADVSAIYNAGRRVRAVGATTTTIYGTIASSSYSPTTTTVNMVWDSGSLANETLVVSLSQIPVTGVPVSSASVSGTKTNNNAASGTVGEFLETVVASGAGISLTTATPKTVINRVLTPGDWDATGVAQITTLGALTNFSASLSQTADTPANSDLVISVAPTPGSANISSPVPTTRFSLTVTSTICLVITSAFSSTAVGYGRVSARRVR